MSSRFPGSWDQEYSEGCNLLIKTNRAHLLQSVKDLEYIMGWECQSCKTKPTQTELFKDLNPEELQVAGFAGKQCFPSC